MQRRYECDARRYDHPCAIGVQTEAFGAVDSGRYVEQVHLCSSRVHRLQRVSAVENCLSRAERLQLSVLDMKGACTEDRRANAFGGLAPRHVSPHRMMSAELNERCPRTWNVQCR